MAKSTFRRHTPEEWRLTFSDFIKRVGHSICIQRRVRQKTQLAVATAVAIDEETYRQIEQGEHVAELPLLWKIATFLDMTTLEMFVSPPWLFEPPEPVAWAEFAVQLDEELKRRDLTLERAAAEIAGTREPIDAPALERILHMRGIPHASDLRVIGRAFGVPFNEDRR